MMDAIPRILAGTNCAVGEDHLAVGRGATDEDNELSEERATTPSGKKASSQSDQPVLVVPNRILVAEKLSRVYGTKWALTDLSLSLAPGTLLALLGPNGAGKTTFLRLAAGALEPTSGQIDVCGMPSRQMVNKNASAVVSMLDGAEPPSWCKIGDLIDLQASATPKFDRSRANECLNARGLTRSGVYGRLSKGQKKWVYCILCFCSGAELLLFDEPADGLDPAVRKELYGHIRRTVNDTGASAIVATHVIGDIEPVADEVAIIDRGKLVLKEELETLREICCEVEGPAGVKLPEKTTLLRKVEAGQRSQYWMITQNRDRLQQAIGSDYAIHNVNLDDLYLAVTQPNEVKQSAGAKA